MSFDSEILKVVHEAFGHVVRPEHFTVADGDPECMDHDQLLRSRTPETLTIEDVGSIGYDPLVECFPHGIAYFFPTLARFALNDSRPHDWYPFQLALHLTRDGSANGFLKYCSSTQRKAVLALFSYIQASRAERIVSECCADEIMDCVDLWRV